MSPLIRTNLKELLLALTRSLDFLVPQLRDHSLRTAYVSIRIGEAMNLKSEDLRTLFLSSLVHDIGILSEKEKKVLFKTDKWEDFKKFSENGYKILKTSKALNKIAGIISHIYTPYAKDREKSSLLSRIITISERIDIYSRKEKKILDVSRDVEEKILRLNKSVFDPEIVKIFLYLSNQESFWFDLIEPSLFDLMKDYNLGDEISLSVDELYEIARIFAHIIDIKSPFTRTHSVNVSEISSEVGGILGFGKSEKILIKIAGLLHDLGKMTVPVSIIDKKGNLNDMEFNIIKSHPYHTFRILSSIKGFRDIARMASFHHEKLDGSGYPFKLSADSLNTEEKIIAVADIYSALYEDRAYRQSFKEDEALKIIKEEGKSGKIDRKIVEALIDNIELLHTIKMKATDKHKSFLQLL